MRTLLHIDSSPRRHSTTRQLSQRFAERWRLAHPSGRIIHRDLVDDPLPHINEVQVDHFFYRPGSYAQEKAKEIRRCEELVEEMRVADLLLLAAPMINFSLPSSVKAWLDHIIWPGHSFDPSTGKGLLDIPAVVVLSRGGAYGPETPRADFNFHDTYLRKVFELIGITDVQFVIAELTAFTQANSTDPVLRAKGERSLNDAFARIQELCPVADETLIDQLHG